MRPAANKVAACGRKVGASVSGWFGRHWGWLVLAVLPVAPIIVHFTLRPPDWLPSPGDAHTILLSLLAVQGSILALSIAVAIFMMASVSNKRDADDRIYREYVRRTWVRGAFWTSVYAIALTAAALLCDWYFGKAEPAATIPPALRNLSLTAALSFFISLVIPLALFERAIHITNPAQWSTLRSDVWRTSARVSAQAYVARRQRAEAALQSGELSFSLLVREQGEGAASEAVQALRGDAQRAMQESRISEFNGALNAIQILVETTMDELEREGVAWSGPSVQPEWPLLWNLGTDLYPLRREVIRRGSLEYLQGLSAFDYWLLSKGLAERCGEVFAAGLDGYRYNYHLAVRSGASDGRLYMRGLAWRNLWIILSDIAPEEAFPYAIEMIRHQAGLLEDAMRGQMPEDYEWLHNQIRNYLRRLIQDWAMQAQAAPRRLNLANELDEAHRVSIMGLAGRAISLSESGELDDPTPYLEVARGEYASARNLAKDVVQALERHDELWGRQWRDWSREGAMDGVSYGVNPQQYPLKFFTVRFTELCDEATTAIGLGGQARRVLSWFEANAGDLLSYVSDAPNATKEDRRERALAFLRKSVKLDELEEDRRIIASELSEEKVAAFKAGLRSTASEVNAVERIFEASDALLYLSTDSSAVPEERSLRDFVEKAPFANPHPQSTIHYVPFDGSLWGRTCANDAMRLFCQSMDRSPASSTSLDSPGELFASIDLAIEEIQPRSEVVAILAGDWSNIEVAFRSQQDQGFIPASSIPGAAVYEWGRYRSRPIVRGLDGGARRLYVVEVAAWGSFTQALYDGDQALSIDMSEIDAERARKILKRQPDLLADYPDEESKLRKLQTQLELGVYTRADFKVKDPSRARRVNHCEQGDCLDGE